MARFYFYNRVMVSNDICPLGELLTDNELDNLKKEQPKRNWPKVLRVKVEQGLAHFNFGVRFASEYDLCLRDYSTEAIKAMMADFTPKRMSKNDYAAFITELIMRK